MDDLLRRDLLTMAQRYQRRKRAAADSYAALVPVILAARKSGATLRAVADLTGLSFARIYQIEKAANRGD